MGSRGAVAKYGYVTDLDYHTVKVTESGVKVLDGYGNNHSLPELAHSPNSIYARFKDNKLYEIRFFDNKGYPIIELAYHPEPKLNNGDKQCFVLHMHLYKGLTRLPAEFITSDVEEKYKDYLKEFELYDKC